MAWSGFVVRPFGKRQVRAKDGSAYEVDFDRVQRDLIDPAMQAAGIRGSTTEVIFKAGNIREDMFQMLAHADIVIADMSIHNANVYYELGARHALRPKRTYLIRYAGDEVPFDIKTDRYLSYSRDEPGASVAALTQGLKDTLADREGVDSPIFKLLPALRPPSMRDLAKLPADFSEELRWAAQNKRVGHLVLLGEEANELPWGAEALRGVGAALFSLKAFEAARRAWEAVRTRLDSDVEADLKLATIYQRMKNLAASDSAVDRALANHPDIRPRDKAEALSLKGSNAKERWMAGWGNAPPEALGPRVLPSDDLKQACDNYAAGFMADLNHHYSGINALAMTRMRMALALAWPDAWAAAYDSDDDAQRELALLKDRVGELEGAVQLSLRRGEKLETPGSENARWVRCSMADAQLLRSKPSTDRVIASYRRALDGAPPFFLDAVRRQLAMYGRLGLFKPVIEPLLPELDKLAGQPSAADGAPVAPAPPPPDRVLLFSGHRIDEPGRAAPRFPADREAVARRAIAEAVDKALASWPAGCQVLGIAGGANGGDILFHEVCAERGIATELYLVMAEADYKAISVRVAAAIDGTPSWIERFNLIRQRCEAAANLHQLGDSAALPPWLAGLRDYSIWERNNRWTLQSALAFGADKLTLLVLWDGQAGDAAGGTQHMVEVAEAAGAVVRQLPSRALFGLG